MSVRFDKRREGCIFISFLFSFDRTMLPNGSIYPVSIAVRLEEGEKNENRLIGNGTPGNPPTREPALRPAGSECPRGKGSLLINFFFFSRPRGSVSRTRTNFHSGVGGTNGRARLGRLEYFLSIENWNRKLRGASGLAGLLTVLPEETEDVIKKNERRAQSRSGDPREKQKMMLHFFHIFFASFHPRAILLAEFRQVFGCFWTLLLWVQSVEKLYEFLYIG